MERKITGAVAAIPGQIYAVSDNIISEYQYIQIEPDFSEAERFLGLLDEEAEIFHFRTFDDSEAKDSKLTRKLSGSFDQVKDELAKLNRQGAGVFVVINEGGHTDASITRIRAVFEDQDQADKPRPHYELEPHLEIESSPGKTHRYWLIDDLPVKRFKSFQQSIASAFGSDKSVCNPSRVMRLPGFIHQKGEPFMTRIIESLPMLPYHADVLNELVKETCASGSEKSSESHFDSQNEPKSDDAFSEGNFENDVHQGHQVHPEAKITQGSRNSYLTSLAGTMQRRHFSPDAILAALLTENAKKCDPPLPEDEVRKIVESITRYAPDANDPIAAAALIREIIATSLKEDAGAVFSPDALAAMKTIRDNDHAEFIRLRAEIKRVNKNALVTEMDKAIRPESGEDEQTLADQLVAFVQERCELFHDPDKVAYVNFEHEKHRETWPLDSKGFKEWLGMAFYRETEMIPKETPLKDAISALSGIAKFDGEEIPVYLRVARIDDKYFIDLCDEGWHVVEVTAQGWRVIASTKGVRFRRVQTSRPLPIPMGGGNLELFWNCANIPQRHRKIIIAWVLECWRADTPFLILELTGEQGTAKSSTQDNLRALIDPNQVNLRARPKNTEDIFISAVNNWLQSYENLSHLSDDMQDAFCTLATGGGFASRTLYTNDEETALAFMRPVVLNGIAAVATRQDLVDRLIHIDLEPIEDRRTQAEIDAAFERDYPVIFGALLDVFVNALTALPNMTIDPKLLPRMADFALFGSAVYAALGIAEPEKSFLADYEEMRRQSILRTLDSSPVASAVQNYLDKYVSFTGTVKKAWETLKEFKHDFNAWPNSPKAFGDALRRCATSLKALGIHAAIGNKTKHGYMVTLAKF